LPDESFAPSRIHRRRKANRRRPTPKKTTTAPNSGADAKRKNAPDEKTVAAKEGGHAERKKAAGAGAPAAFIAIGAWVLRTHLPRAIKSSSTRVAADADPAHQPFSTLS
jgi:sarcosine oxidase gamma subunit